jgi:hypothetical protein
MGFNPFRPRHRDSVDLVMVVGTVVIVVALLVWAIWG